MKKAEPILICALIFALGLFFYYVLYPAFKGIGTGVEYGAGIGAGLLGLGAGAAGANYLLNPGTTVAGGNTTIPSNESTQSPPLDDPWEFSDPGLAETFNLPLP